jgi:hypothetical protein
LLDHRTLVGMDDYLNPCPRFKRHLLTRSV